MSSFSAALARQPWPGVRCLGQKEFIQSMGDTKHSGGRRPSRGHGSALTRWPQHSPRSLRPQEGP
jgi:hypothetical protein